MANDREAMIEVIKLAKEDFARETASYLEFGDETDLIADRLIEAGFGTVRFPLPKQGCGKEFDRGEDIGILTCGGHLDGEDWYCEECRSKS